MRTKVEISVKDFYFYSSWEALSSVMGKNPTWTVSQCKKYLLDKLIKNENSK